MSKDVDKMRKRLEKAGLSVDETGSGHYEVRDDGKRVTTISKTPSVWSWERKCRSDLKRGGVDLERRPSSKGGRKRRVSRQPELDLETVTAFTPPVLPTVEEARRQLELENLRATVRKRRYFAAGDISLGLVPLQPRGRRSDPSLTEALKEMAGLSGVSLPS